MLKFYKVLKIKILEKVKIGFEKLFLVERRHLKVKTIDYLVCKDYKKSSNTYSEGFVFEDPRVAYNYFNVCLKAGDIVSEEGETNVDTSSSI